MITHVRVYEKHKAVSEARVSMGILAKYSALSQSEAQLAHTTAAASAMSIPMPPTDIADNYYTLSGAGTREGWCPAPFLKGVIYLMMTQRKIFKLQL